MKLEHFDRQQIKSAVTAVRKQWGSMWDLCGPEVRLAFIEQYVVQMMLTVSVTKATINKAVLQECLMAMRVEAGLVSEDE